MFSPVFFDASESREEDLGVSDSKARAAPARVYARAEQGFMIELDDDNGWSVRGVASKIRACESEATRRDRS